MVRKRLLILICFWLLLGIPFVWGQEFPFSIDFESGDLRGWKKSGNAFVFQPTKGDNPTARHREQPSNHQGKYWIGTYEKYQGKQGQKRGDIQGDGPTGTLTSASFSIPSGTLSFLIGGGSGFKTRVEFFVLDPLEGYIRMKHASGKNSETMQRITWDLDPYAGKKGQIRIVDASSEGWGHINVDDFRFSAANFIQPPIIHFQPGEVIHTSEVPNVIGNSLYEAKTIIDAAHLEVAEAKREISIREPGTVVRQHPAAGSRVARGTSVTLWIAEKKEFPKPKAVIHTSTMRVRQGEPAVFESRSVYDPDGSIVERWRGPDQTGEGRAFEVNTRYLMPGEYRILLDIVDSHNQKDRASATLYVEPPPVEYRLSLKTAPNRIEANQKTRLIAAISPEAPDAGYRFDFGDGETYAEGGRPDAVHVYRAPGVYDVSVAVTIGQRSLSKTIRVTVQEQQAIVHDQWPPLWILIAVAVGGLAVLGGGAYLCRRKPWKSEIEKSTDVVVTIRAKEGKTNQEIDKESLQKDIEVRFRPVGDAGTQKIKQKDDIVGRERSDYE